MSTRYSVPCLSTFLTLGAIACSASPGDSPAPPDAASTEDAAVVTTGPADGAAEGPRDGGPSESEGAAEASEPHDSDAAGLSSDSSDPADAGTCRPPFSSGVNVAWINFAKDVPHPALAAFDQLFQNTFNAGGRVVRWWFHANGTSTPGYQSATDPYPGEARPITAAEIDDVKSILDTAYADHVMVTISLWSFDMLQGAEDIPLDTLADNYALLTEDVNRQAYIDNVLTPLVTALKGYHGLYAWEIFNEGEGMTTQFGWTANGVDGGAGLRVDEGTVQKCVNWFADAIHTADPLALVTEGVWQFIANANTSTGTATFKNYYSDDALLAAGADGGSGGRGRGILDFYEDHYYDTWSGSEVVSPFTHPAAYWELDKPIVIGEFWPLETNGVAAADLYTTLFGAGYAGAWAWQYANLDNPGPDASTVWPAEKVPMENLFALHPEDLECSGDPEHEGPDGAGSCTTSLTTFTDAGGQLLYGFDEGAVAGWLTQAMDSAGAGLAGTLGDSLTDGHACPGALTLTVPFTAYGSQENANVQVSVGSANWTAYTKLHFWIRLIASSYPAISGVQGYVQSDSYANYTSQFVGSSGLADGAWHEIVVDLTNLAEDSFSNVPEGGTIDLAMVNALGVQVSADTAAPASGPAAPATVTLWVDDIWVESP